MSTFAKINAVVVAYSSELPRTLYGTKLFLFWLQSGNMKLNTKAIRYLTSEDWRVLAAVSQNQEIVSSASSLPG